MAPTSTMTSRSEMKLVLHDDDTNAMLVVYDREGQEAAAFPLTVGDLWRLGCDFLLAWMRKANK